MKHLIVYALLAVVSGLAVPSGASALEETVRAPGMALTVDAPPTFPHHHHHHHHRHHHHHHRRHHHRI